MRIDPDGPFTPKTGQSDEPSGQPKRDFPKIKKKQDQEEKTAAKKKEAELKSEKRKPRGLAALFGQQQQQALSIETGKGGAGGAGSVEKLMQVFQDPNNRFFASSVQTVGLSEQGGETRISVLLENGVSVDIDLGQGFQDLNITITGVTAAMQDAIDNQAHQDELRTKLLEAGFRIHQITTVRGDQPSTAGVSQARMQTAPPSETPEGQTQERGDEESPGEEKEQT